MEKQKSFKNYNDYDKSTNIKKDKKQQDNKRNYLIYGLLLAIIAVLLVGVIYQFVCIKKMQNQLEKQNSSAVVIIDKDFDKNFCNY